MEQHLVRIEYLQKKRRGIIIKFCLNDKKKESKSSNEHQEKEKVNQILTIDLRVLLETKIIRKVLSIQ